MILATVKLDVFQMFEQMLPGMANTLSIFFLTLIFSLPLGVIILFGEKVRFKPVRWIFQLFIAIMRGTPLMLQLFVVYFVPTIAFSIAIPDYRFIAVILAFSLNYAAYFAEIYRSGLEAMPEGQYEAADLLGYNKFQTYTKIIFPQVLKIIVPSITNEIICLVKDTSIAFAIAYQEMFTIAKQLVASQTTLMPFVISAVFYFIFNAIVAFVMNYIAKKMDYYK